MVSARAGTFLSVLGGGGLKQWRIAALTFLDILDPRPVAIATATPGYYANFIQAVRRSPSLPP